MVPQISLMTITGTTNMLRKGFGQVHSLKAMTYMTAIHGTEKSTHRIMTRCAKSFGFVSQSSILT